MNKFVAIGRLPRPAVVNGTEEKVVKFTLACCHGHDRAKHRDLVSYVPCVVFQPGPELLELLTEDWQGLVIELEGHVATSKFVSEGHTRYSTEVVVDKNRIRMVPELEALPFNETQKAADAFKGKAA